MEEQLVTYCSPTLASLKTANLFRYVFSSKETLQQEIDKVSLCLNPKGVFVEIMDMRQNTALLLVYRKNRLQQELLQEDVAEFLKCFGYLDNTLPYCVKHLKDRLALHNDFPHEIGVFLGYPLWDIQGFISNKGENCKLSGVWKVYDNEHFAQKLFERYKRCKRAYEKQFSKGRGIRQLTVAA